MNVMLEVANEAGGNSWRQKPVCHWESDIGKLAVGFYYQLNRFVVQIFIGRK